MTKEEVNTDLRKLARQHVKNIITKRAFPDLSAKYPSKELTGTDIAKYLALYGGGGALLGAGTGALLGGSSIGGSIAGGAAGTALGALALNARKDRDQARSNEQAAKFEFFNWLSKLPGKWPQYLGAGGAGAATGLMTDPKHFATLEKGLKRKIPSFLKRKIPGLKYKPKGIKRLTPPKTLKGRLGRGVVGSGVGLGLGLLGDFLLNQYDQAASTYIDE